MSPCKSEVRPSPKSLAREGETRSQVYPLQTTENTAIQRLRCTRCLMKNFFSYQSCTKKKFQVFTTQCCPSSSLDPTLPSLPTPNPQSTNQRNLRPAMQQLSQEEREREKKSNSPKVQPSNHRDISQEKAGHGRASAVCSSQDDIKEKCGKCTA